MILQQSTTEISLSYRNVQLAWQRPCKCSSSRKNKESWESIHHLSHHSLFFKKRRVLIYAMFDRSIKYMICSNPTPCENYRWTEAWWWDRQVRQHFQWEDAIWTNTYQNINTLDLFSIFLSLSPESTILKRPSQWHNEQSKPPASAKASYSASRDKTRAESFATASTARNSPALLSLTTIACWKRMLSMKRDRIL